MAHRHEQQAGNSVAAVALAALLTVASGSMSAADAKMVLGKQFSSTEASGSAFDMTGVLAAQSRDGSQSVPCRLLIAVCSDSLQDGACSFECIYSSSGDHSLCFPQASRRGVLWLASGRS